jgi:putative two-component system response regulator
MKKSVLVADTSKINLEILEEILDPFYQVIACSDPQEIEKQAKLHKPDLILIEIHLGEVSGYEVNRVLKSDSKTRAIPVIFITAADQPEIEEKALEEGAVDFLTKPLRPTLVLARIKTHLLLADRSHLLEEQVAEKTREVLETRLDIIQILGKAAEFKDNETGSHVHRIGLYSEALARGYGFEPENCGLIRHAAPMHDIGKIGIPDSVLLKPGKLNELEWQIMQTHTTIGKDILENQTSTLLQAARIIAYQHHEKWDGSGYPSKLKGDDIHIFARIVALVDVFDALSSKRPYKEPWPLEKTLQLIKAERGIQFDPHVTDIFFENLNEILNIQKMNEDIFV